MQNNSESNGIISGVKLLAAYEHPPWRRGQEDVGYVGLCQRATSLGLPCLGGDQLRRGLLYFNEYGDLFVKGAGTEKTPLTVRARSKHHYEPNFQY